MMLKNKRGKRNIAGVMGAAASQPAQRVGQTTVDPLERAQQKMSGRTQGRALSGVKKKSKPTIMTSYGIL